MNKMKITKTQLQQLIKEELTEELQEAQGISDLGLKKAISMVETIRDLVEDEEKPIAKSDLLDLIARLRDFLRMGY